MVFFGISAFKIWKEAFKGEITEVIVGPAVATGSGAQTHGASIERAQKTDPVAADAEDLELGTPTTAEKGIAQSKEDACFPGMVVVASDMKGVSGFGVTGE